MRSQGLTQTDVAARLGIDKSGLSRPLSGALTLPMAERIADALGVRISFDLESK
ncbi:helix-turn-helix transcriptional regulator [Iamia majanohamensis]|uniref:Helix-turn-helix transcriptional regulator n=1 Tax=Iamia majanohamensis TaxID=467976 RepID=A0AAE9YE92_9ACTN|nr:helix-turn-helix transcriptional regulator [Iamia majanohamensis]WCO69224.1 helix-turn-helix transcriptional regulator [Iamia majanohamensis]